MASKVCIEWKKPKQTQPEQLTERQIFFKKENEGAKSGCFEICLEISHLGKVLGSSLPEDSSWATLKGNVMNLVENWSKIFLDIEENTFIPSVQSRQNSLLSLGLTPEEPSCAFGSGFASQLLKKCHFCHLWQQLQVQMHFSHTSILLLSCFCSRFVLKCVWRADHCPAGSQWIWENCSVKRAQWIFQAFSRWEDGPGRWVVVFFKCKGKMSKKPPSFSSVIPAGLLSVQISPSAQTPGIVDPLCVHHGHFSIWMIWCFPWAAHLQEIRFYL